MVLLNLKEEIFKERRLGKNIVEMSEIFNVDVCTLVTLLSNNDENIIDDEINAIINFLNTKIAEYRINKDRVNAIKTIEKLEFAKEFLHIRNIENKKKEAQNIYEILELREEGHTLQRIGTKMKMSPTTVSEILETYSSPLHAIYRRGTKLKFIDLSKFGTNNKKLIEKKIKKEYLGNSNCEVVYIENNNAAVIDEFERFLKSNLKKELIVTTELTIYIVNNKKRDDLVEIVYRAKGKKRGIYQKYIVIRRAMRCIEKLELHENI